MTFFLIKITGKTVFFVTKQLPGASKGYIYDFLMKVRADFAIKR